MSKKKLLAEVVIPLYKRTYIESDNVRPKYFEKGTSKKMPLQYCNKHLWKTQGVRMPDGVNYVWKSFPVVRQKQKKHIEMLVEASTGQRVIANPNQTGKKKISVINGQSIYNGTVSRFTRNRMLGQIKDQMRTYIQDLEPITEFPIRIIVGIFDYFEDSEFSNDKDWDVDNRFYPYAKAFPDLLQKEGKLPNDHRKYITQPPSPLFFPIDETNEERKLVFRIYKDKRPCILKSKHYQNY